MTGNGNTVSVQFQQASLPEPEPMNIQAELQALQAIWASFDGPIANGVAHKLKQ